MENLLELDPEVFEKDKTLFSELFKRLTDASNTLGCVSRKTLNYAKCVVQP